MPPSSRPTDERSPCDGALTIGWASRTQVAFVRVLGRFPQQAPLEIDGEILRFAALQLGADAETIHAYAGRQQTVSEHQQRIGEYPRVESAQSGLLRRRAQGLPPRPQHVPKADRARRCERTAGSRSRDGIRCPSDVALTPPRAGHVGSPTDVATVPSSTACPTNRVLPARVPTRSYAHVVPALRREAAAKMEAILTR